MYIEYIWIHHIHCICCCQCLFLPCLFIHTVYIYTNTHKYMFYDENLFVLKGIRGDARILFSSHARSDRFAVWKKRRLYSLASACSHMCGVSQVVLYFFSVVIYIFITLHTLWNMKTETIFTITSCFQLTLPSLFHPAWLNPNWEPPSHLSFGPLESHGFPLDFWTDNRLHWILAPDRTTTPGRFFFGPWKGNDSKQNQIGCGFEFKIFGQLRILFEVISPWSQYLHLELDISRFSSVNCHIFGTFPSIGSWKLVPRTFRRAGRLLHQDVQGREDFLGKEFGESPRISKQKWHIIYIYIYIYIYIHIYI